MANDEEVRDRVATGDFTDLLDAELTETERAMVTAAAEDFPEVEGFLMEGSGGVPNTVFGTEALPPRLAAAVAYSNVAGWSQGDFTANSMPGDANLDGEVA